MELIYDKKPKIVFDFGFLSVDSLHLRLDVSKLFIITCHPLLLQSQHLQRRHLLCLHLHQRQHLQLEQL